MANRSEDVLGVYAGADSTGKTVTVVIINKDVQPVGLYLANVPTGKYFLRHFGGQAGVAKWQVSLFVDERMREFSLTMTPCRRRSRSPPIST